MTRSKHVIEQVLTGFEAKRNKRDNTRGVGGGAFLHVHAIRIKIILDIRNYCVHV